MNRVERSFMPNSPKLIDLAFKSKNLYNCATFIMRQNFIHNGKIINYPRMDKIIKRDYEDVYRALPAQTTQQILRLIEKDWKSFFKANRRFKKNPEVFTGKPKLPNYKDKTEGLGIIIFTNQQCKIKNNFVHFPKAVGLDPIKTTVNVFSQVRIIPKFKHFVIEIVYSRQPIKNKVDFKNVFGIDLGLNNLATLVSNQLKVPPMLINGRPLKSINQFFNKTKAELMSNIGDKGSSNKIGKLSLKRECKMNDYMHKASRSIIDYAIGTKTGTIIVGENEGWKQKIKTGKKNNQNFVSVPLDKLKEMIAYKAEDNGIQVIFTEEAYTSKASSLDKDPIPAYSPENKLSFTGKRIKRGLYQWSKGIINADLNGALNIIRKEVPESLDELIRIRNRGCGFQPFKVLAF